jgi:hypothetical protein
MADIYFKETWVLSGPYWKLCGVKNLEPEKRGALNLLLSEYIVLSGDISNSKADTDEKLKELRDDMVEAGHIIHLERDKSWKRT